MSHRDLEHIGGEDADCLRETAHLGVRRNEDLILPLKLEIDEPSRSSRSQLTNIDPTKRRKSRVSHATGDGSLSAKRATKRARGLVALKRHQNKALGRTIIGDSSVERSKLFATSRLSKHSLNSASRYSNTKSRRGYAGRSDLSQRKAGTATIKPNVGVINQYAHHSIMLPQSKTSLTISETRVRTRRVPSKSRKASQSIKKSTYSSREILQSSNPVPAYMLREEFASRSPAKSRHIVSNMRHLTKKQSKSAKSLISVDENRRGPRRSASGDHISQKSTPFK